ncbi:MAG: prephenate dehydratase [bacterium]
MRYLSVLGPAGTFTDMAADLYLQRTQKQLSKLYFSSITKSLLAVNNETISVAPVENLIDGFIGPTLDFLELHKAVVIDELIIPVNHCLASKHVALSKIKKVYVQFSTHQQCKNFLEDLAVLLIINTESNIISAEKASADPDSAAIIPIHAAETFGLKVLKESIQDFPNNKTRFIVVANKAVPELQPAVFYKTSLLIGVQDKPGSLRDILSAFADRKINMTSIMSRPTKGKLGQYHFFIDIEGHQLHESVQQALNSIKKHNSVKLLGSYPEALQ